MTNPNILPPRFRFEQVAENNYDTLMRQLDKYYRARRGTFIDQKLELMRPSIINLTDRLSEVLVDRELFYKVKDPEANKIAYHTFYFAFALGSRLFPDCVDAFLDSFDQIGSSARSDEELNHMAQVYLADRPTLDGLINAFSMDIDTWGRYGHTVDGIAGLVLMHMEALAVDVFVDEQLAEFIEGFENL